MHSRFQERDFSIRLGRAMALAANHFMTTKEFEAFDECCKISARAVNEGITEAELIELESFVSPPPAPRSRCRQAKYLVYE